MAETAELGYLGEQMKRLQEDAKFLRIGGKLLREDVHDLRVRLQALQTDMTDLRKVDERFAGLDAKVDGRFADLSTKVDLMRDGMDNSFAMLREVIERRG